MNSYYRNKEELPFSVQSLLDPQKPIPEEVLYCAARFPIFRFIFYSGIAIWASFKIPSFFSDSGLSGYISNPGLLKNTWLLVVLFGLFYFGFHAVNFASDMLNKTRKGIFWSQEFVLFKLIGDRILYIPISNVSFSLDKMNSLLIHLPNEKNPLSIHLASVHNKEEIIRKVEELTKSPNLETAVNLPEDQKAKEISQPKKEKDKKVTIANLSFDEKYYLNFSIQEVEKDYNPSLNYKPSKDLDYKPYLDDLVKKAVEKGINFRSEEGFTALDDAINMDYPNLTKSLISAGANVNSVDSYGNTPLMTSISRGHWNIFTILLDAGADIEAKDKRGNTPLMHSANLGRSRFLLELIQRGANVNATDNEGESALTTAITTNRPIIAKFLLEHGANIDDKNKNGNTRKDWLRISGSCLELYHVVFNDAMFMERNLGVSTIKASLENHLSQEDRSLLGKKLNELQKPNKYGESTISQALLYGNYHLAKLLIEKGVDLDFRNTYQNTVLIDSITNGNYPKFLFLLNFQLDIEAKNSYGKTPFILACEHGHIFMAKELLKKNANINAQGNDGDTALLCAAMKNRVNVVRFLLENGADKNIKDSKGHLPIDWARIEGGEPEIFELLGENV